MKKFIILIISLINYANAALYFSGGLGMTQNNDKLYSSSTAYYNGGEAQYTGAFNFGYQPVTNKSTDNKYFIDLGLNYPFGDNLVAKATNSYEVKQDLELVLRLGSMFRASQKTYPYVFVAGVYNLGVELDSGALSTKTSKDILGYGGGLGIRSFVGKNGFYDFSYLYHTASEESLGTYSDASKANFTMSRGVFTAAIGHMF